MKNPFEGAMPHPLAAQMSGKPQNLSMPHYQGHPNFALNQIDHVSANPVHIAHVEKAFQLHAPHLKPNAAGGPPQGPGSPWVMMSKTK